MTDEAGQRDSSVKVRASDAEREAVVERLRVATAEGRLTFGALTERTKAAYTATTRGELVPLRSLDPDSCCSKTLSSVVVLVIAGGLGPRSHSLRWDRGAHRLLTDGVHTPGRCSTRNWQACRSGAQRWTRLYLVGWAGGVQIPASGGCEPSGRCHGPALVTLGSGTG